VIKNYKNEKGMIGYKKCRLHNENGIFISHVLVRVLVPYNVRYRCPNSSIDIGRWKKYRAEKVKVLEFIDCRGKPFVLKRGYAVFSAYDGRTRYYRNRILKSNGFDTEDVACSSGIHFFKNLKEASRYDFS